jgi:hypothetical protein
VILAFLEVAATCGARGEQGWELTDLKVEWPRVAGVRGDRLIGWFRSLAPWSVLNWAVKYSESLGGQGYFLEKFSIAKPGGVGMHDEDCEMSLGP